MAPSQSLDKIIQQHAATFADAVRGAARTAKKEEDIRVVVERQIELIAQAAHVTLEGEHEFTVASGEADSVYQRVIVEYKNPSSPAARIGTTLDSPGSKKLVAQIKSRFPNLQHELGQPIHSLFGVGCDGCRFIFVRWRDEKWDIPQPVEIDRFSAERFIWALFNLGTSGRPFLPRYLADDFGSTSPLAQQAVSALYKSITATAHPKAQVFFRQWKLLFDEVCGFDVDRPSKKLKILARSYGVHDPVRPAELLFAVHTYYAIFMKLLAATIIARFHGMPGDPLSKLHAASNPQKFKEEMEDVEAGSVFRHFNITNFLEGDLFAWYLLVWTNDIHAFLSKMVDSLDGYNPQTLAEEPALSRDLLKKLYQELFPKTVRHDLGEYYTPDWLAERVLDDVGYDGNPELRVLDPACGSGTFVVLAISRIRNWFEENRDSCPYDEAQLCEKILANVVGFDLNPLAVMAARTNYLIAIRGLISGVAKVEIPIYLCDSILTPSNYGGLWSATTEAAKELPIAPIKNPLLIPTEIARTKEDLNTYAATLERCIREDFTPKEFIERCRVEGLTITQKKLHTQLYGELLRLEKSHKNGIWARIIKNAFAPLFVGSVDYVVGNPPWVNWESLPASYRDTTKPIWERYGLFTLKGHSARLGGGKKDLSMLFVYVSIDSYLKPAGRLGFVLTQTLFKTREAAAGFRRFRFEKNKQLIHIVPLSVIDFTDLHPFEGAVNRTATFICKSSREPVSWPVPYSVWSIPETRAVPQDAELSEIESTAVRRDLIAKPMISTDPTSAWITADADALPALLKITGKNQVKAHAGVCTWINGIFWLRDYQIISANKARIQNWHDVGKIKVEAVETTIEDELIYPLLRGRDVHRWRSTPSAHILLTQDPETRTGIPTQRMKRDLPLTYTYLRRFEALLRGRPGYKKYFDPKKDPFWTIYNVGTYSISQHRVVFKELTDFFQCAVPESSNGKPSVADTKLRFIECLSSDEAFFICGLLNSSPAVLYLYSTATWVQTADYQASDIARLNLPRYDPSLSLHREIARISKESHVEASKSDGYALRNLELSLDERAAALWNLDHNEIRSIERALDELGFREKITKEAVTLEDEEGAE